MLMHCRLQIRIRPQNKHDIHINKYGYIIYIYYQYFNLSISTSTYTLPNIEQVPVLRNKYLWNIEDTSTSSTWILYSSVIECTPFEASHGLRARTVAEARMAIPKLQLLDEDSEDSPAAQA